MTETMGFCRGDVVVVRLEPVEGSEQGGTRPALVISNDRLNRTLPVLTVAAITSRKTDRVYMTEVLIEPPEGGLRQVSKVLLQQIRTIAHARILDTLGTASAHTMRQVDAALRLVLDLS